MASSEPTPPPKSFATDPALYIFTSLTAGSSHIVTATSRLETILRANKVPFKAVDIATDERARMIWGRRAGKDEGGRVRKLPGLVQQGVVLGDLVEIEDWNEYGELRQHVKMYYDEFTQPSISQKPKTPPPRKAAAAGAPPAPAENKQEPTPAATATTAAVDTAAKAADTAAQATLPIRSIAAEAAAKAKQMAKGPGGTDAKKENVKAGGEAKVKADAAAGGDKKSEKEKPSPIPVGTIESPSSPKLADLQSPTTGAWKGDSAGGLVSRTVQSPTSSSWVPKDVEPPITQLHGGKVASASAEEIKKVEEAAVIKEEPEEEEGDDEDEEDEDEEDGEDEDGEDEDEDEMDKDNPSKTDEKKA